jgi:hyperosmotically inducible periplasmic protein
MASQQSTRAAVSDGVITARVRAALHEDPLTAEFDIQVDTLAHVVKLTGFVETTVVRDEALQVAWSVEGVEQVNDVLDIRLLRRT